MKHFTLLVVLCLFAWQGNAQITAYPYVEDFEAGAGGWTTAGTLWQLGTPAGTTINTAGSGTNSWATGLATNYPSNANESITSPVFDFTTVSNPAISMNIWWNAENSWDGTTFQSSIDGGTTWQTVGAFGDPNNWFNDNTINGSPGGQSQGWTGRNSTGNGSGGWVTASHDLTGLGGNAGVTFRFAFGSDGSGTDNGFAFDDISVTNAPITTFPYVEDFEAGAGGWATAGTLWQLGTPAGTTINTAGSGTNSWATGLATNYPSNANESITSPVFDFTTVSNPAISMNIWWNAENSWDGTTFQSSIDGGTTWQTVGAFGDPNNWFNDNTINGSPGGQSQGWTGRNSTGNGSGGWVTASHDLTGLGGNAGVTFRFAFGSDGSGTDNGFAFDDISVTLITCASPSALTATAITSTSADLVWTDNAASGLSNVEYGTGGFVLGSGTQILGTTNNLESITGLTPNTAYEFYVQSDCGVGVGQSAWVGPFSFTTPCSVITPNYLQAFATFVPDACWSEATAGTVATGPSSFGLGNWSAGTAIGNTVRVNLYSTNVNDWVLSPNFDLSLGGYEVALDVAVTNWNSSAPDVMGSDDVITVAYSEDGITWTALMSWSAADALPNTLTPFSALIPSLGSNVQFGILASDGTVNDLEDYDFHFDNFEVRLPPSCPSPSALTATNITATSADLGWTDNASAGLSNVEYGTVGFSQGTGTLITGTSNNPETVTGLTPETGYEFYVQSDCGLGDFSTWSGPFSFTTPCAAIIAPYTEDVETHANSFGFTESNCWTSSASSGYDWNITGTGTTTSSGTGALSANSGTKYFYTEASSGTPGATCTLTSPVLDASAMTAPALQFWYHMHGAQMGDLAVEVWDGTSWNQVSLIAGEQQVAQGDGFIRQDIDLAGYANSGLQVRFIATSAGTFAGDICIDDFSVVEFCTIDWIAPVADLGSLPDITASCEVVSLTDPTATDNCSVVTVSNDATLPIQLASTITWTYTDALGNFSTQTQNVVFNDLILPTASNPADSSYECVADAVIDGAVVTDAVDNCSATTVTHVGDVVSGNGCQDTITRTYKVTDGSGNFVEVVQMIYIEDLTDPTASNPTSLNVQCIGDVPAPSAGWVTDEADNCAAAPVVAFVGDVSDGLSCPETITRTFSVTDNCGNQTTVDQLIIIMDMTAPIGDIASLPALTGNCDITPSTATATDNCDGAMNGTPDMAFPITAAGTTTVTWTFTDACGNTTAQTQDVVITPVDVTTSMASDGITIVVNNNGQTYQWIDCITGQAIPGETSYNFTPTYGSEFAVIITENGCSDTSACVNSTVGIGEIGIKTLVLYPNPTNGMLTIDFEGEIKNIEVVDMLGRRVKTIVSIENKSVDATELTPGKYMIRITTENDQVLLEEFVLQN